MKKTISLILSLVLLTMSSIIVGAQPQEYGQPSMIVAASPPVKLPSSSPSPSASAQQGAAAPAKPSATPSGGAGVPPITAKPSATPPSSGQSGGVSASPAASAKQSAAPSSGAVASASPQPTSSSAVDPVPDVKSQAAIVIDAKTGKILFGKNTSERLYPASTTKIMTAIVALEHGNLEDIVTISKSAFVGVTADSSTAGLKVDEKISLENLLYALLVSSGNESANAIAEHIGGSVDGFVAMMNAKAAEIGAKNTNFVNPNGLHNDNHYTTAQDLAVIASYAMKNEKFKTISNTAHYYLPPATANGAKRYIVTTNHLISRLVDTKYYYQPAIGIKTGHTSQAGSCLVSSAKKNGLDLICVVLKAPTVGNDVYSFIDSKNLYEYVFNNFTQKTVIKRNEIVQEIPIKEGSGAKTLNLLTNGTIETLLLKNVNTSTLQRTYKLPASIQAPVSEGDVVGSMDILSDGQVIGTVGLVSAKSIKLNEFEHNLNKVKAFFGLTAVRIVLFVIVGLVVILFVLRYVVNRKNRRIRRG